jgi:DNA-binding NtrC family response regulator
MSRRILVIDDAASAFEPVLAQCVPSAKVVRCAPREWRATAARFDLLMPVALAPAPHWSTLFDALKRRAAAAPVLAVVGAEAGADVLTAAARAADDFMIWSADRASELRQRIVRLFGPMEYVRAITENLTRDAALGQMIGEDAAFQSMLDRVPVVAASNGAVLILGETGTGKELFARAIHTLSARRQQPFVPVDCAALPDHLLENELFGHARGAFTDAHRDQSGLVAMAEGGTLFLDEIDSLALTVQAKLLRLLEERVYKPLGADRFARANIRIVAASNRPLDELVRKQQFRSDLYFRLNVLQLRLPPLRTRRGDIVPLARHFLQRIATESANAPRVLSPTAIEKLVAAPWPGNVRELYNVMQRACVFGEGHVILPSHITLSDDEGGDAAPPVADGFREAKERSVETFERTYVEDLLRKHNGNVTQAAREARKDRRAFARLIQKHRIDRGGLVPR